MIVIEWSAALDHDGFIKKECSQVVRIAHLKCIRFFVRFQPSFRGALKVTIKAQDRMVESSQQRKVAKALLAFALKGVGYCMYEVSLPQLT